METDYKKDLLVNPDPGCASDRNLLPHLVCQLGISFRQRGLQVHKLFQERKGEEEEVEKSLK